MLVGAKDLLSKLWQESCYLGLPGPVRVFLPRGLGFQMLGSQQLSPEVLSPRHGQAAQGRAALRTRTNLPADWRKIWTDCRNDSHRSNPYLHKKKSHHHFFHTFAEVNTSDTQFHKCILLHYIEKEPFLDTPVVIFFIRGLYLIDEKYSEFWDK